MYLVISRLQRGANTTNYNPPVQSVVGAVAGDIYTLEARARCFGNGDVVNPKAPVAPVLHTYNIQMDCASYYSGDSGAVIPAGLDDINDPNNRCCEGPLANTTPRNTDITIDRQHPLFAFTAADLDGAVVTGTSFAVSQGQACAFRLFAALNPPAPEYNASSFCQGSNQPEVYLATLRVRVSGDAAGQFDICMDDFNGNIQGENPGGPDRSILFTLGQGDPPATNRKVFPLVYECASITVEVNECDATISPNTFPANAIDARQPTSLDGTNPTGITMLDVDADRHGVSCFFVPSHFSTSFAPPNPGGPTVNSVSDVDADTVKLGLTSSIPVSSWTQITKVNDVPPNSSVCVGYLPGDVNQNRTTNLDDLQSLLACLSGGQVCGIYQADLDRSDAISVLDLERHIELLTGADGFSEWAGAQIVASPCGS